MKSAKIATRHSSTTVTPPRTASLLRRSRRQASRQRLDVCVDGTAARPAAAARLVPDAGGDKAIGEIHEELHEGEEDGEDEVGEADAESGEAHADIVPRTVLIDGGQDAEGDAARDGNGQGHGTEEERDGEGLDEDLAHRPRLVDEGLSEVAPERFADEDGELLPEGLVEAVGLRQVLLRLGGEWVGALGDGIERAAR